MKPSRFDYRCVENVDEALAALAEAGDEARLLAGGQSLIPLMSLRLAAPSLIVDLGGLDDLRYIAASDGWLRIGAMTTQRDLERSADVVQLAPMLAYAARFIGHRAIRNRGTVGGSVCHADPAAELPTVLTALEAEFVARGQAGERVIAASDFFETLFTTALVEDEMLTEIRIPADGSRPWSFREVSRRHGDFAIVSVSLATTADGTPRIVLGGMGPTPVRAHAAERMVNGMANSDAELQEVAHIAVETSEPSSDVHASAATRVRIAETLVRRGLARLKESSAGNAEVDQ